MSNNDSMGQCLLFFLSRKWVGTRGAFTCGIRGFIICFIVIYKNAIQGWVNLSFIFQVLLGVIIYGVRSAFCLRALAILDKSRRGYFSNWFFLLEWYLSESLELVLQLIFDNLIIAANMASWC